MALVDAKRLAVALERQRYEIIDVLDYEYLQKLKGVEIEVEYVMDVKHIVLWFGGSDYVRARYSCLDQIQCHTQEDFREMVRCRLAWALYRRFYL